MAKSKQHTPPSTHQLRQYVAGTLTPQDQHKVEKEALQNQQVDDTLEGLQAMKKAGVDESEALLDVRRRLQQRISPQKRRLVPYYYASAAAVVVAVGLGWWLVQQQDLPESTAKTMAEKVLPSAPVPESTPILEENSPTLSAKPNTQTLTKKPMHFGTFYDCKGEAFDTVHFPNIALRYPFRGRGFYSIKGKVVEDFGIFAIEVNWMDKLPMLNPKTKGKIIALPEIAS